MLNSICCIGKHRGRDSASHQRLPLLGGQAGPHTKAAFPVSHQWDVTSQKTGWRAQGNWAEILTLHLLTPARSDEKPQLPYLKTEMRWSRLAGGCSVG